MGIIDYTKIKSDETIKYNRDAPQEYTDEIDELL
ncbi:hypothetical protein CLV62_13531 [Dysgonomonas alginatilytica]|uniref:Uncharacterized protein n=1 Tax=Dysgonomonas alginatilytica TaxID=1605892 RepID=A0A2V3PKV1_9BACT|nr:hypothetical protein CLV62_13531 [Dysgonomonas alginatilytica]